MGLYGCAGEAVPPPPARLRSPEARLMVPPLTLPAVAEKTDAFRSDSQCSLQYVEEAEKLRSLQTYARTVTKKR